MIASKARHAWEMKIKTEVASYKKYCIKCLTDPQTKADRKFRKHLKFLCKDRVNAVLKRADDRGVEIELDAVRKVSQMEVLEILVREKRDEMEKEMEQYLRRLHQGGNPQSSYDLAINISGAITNTENIITETSSHRSLADTKKE
jgi:hypothetical protein